MAYTAEITKQTQQRSFLLWLSRIVTVPTVWIVAKDMDSSLRTLGSYTLVPPSAWNSPSLSAWHLLLLVFPKQLTSTVLKSVGHLRIRNHVHRLTLTELTTSAHVQQTCFLTLSYQQRILSWPHMQVLEEQSSTQTQYWKQSAQHVTTGNTTPHSL